MKNEFFEYNMKQSGSIDKIIKEGTIILDTNALLNLYRFSSDNREKFFEILDRVEARLFLTNHSVKEFYKNRINILNNKANFKVNLKESMKNNMEHIKKMLENGNFNDKNKESCNLIKHELSLKEAIIKSIENAMLEIESFIDSYEIDIEQTFIDHDPILDRILNSFDGKVNCEFTKDEISKIYKEGIERYKSKIPPGYKDINKEEPHCYGDLIIWKEMIKISKDKNCSILFVSDDRKEDWCDKQTGRDLGPRKELIKEFRCETDNLFYSLTTKDFIKRISVFYEIENTIELEQELDILRDDLLNNENNINELNSNASLKAFSISDSLAEYRQAMNSLPDPFKEYIQEANSLQNITDSFKIPDSFKEYRQAINSLPDSFKEYIQEANSLQNITDSFKIPDSFKEYRQVMNSLPDSVKRYRQVMNSLPDPVKKYMGKMEEDVNEYNRNEQYETIDIYEDDKLNYEEE